MKFNTAYPSLQDLKQKAKKSIPKFAFDFLQGGSADENSIHRNQQDLQSVYLQQHFIRPMVQDPSLKSSLCGIPYDLPFGVSPVGLQGIIWPNASKILAKSAKQYNIPYVMSTMCTNTIEEIAEVSEGNALFQLYNPEDINIRKDLLKRVKNSGMRALIVTVDIATKSHRSREMRNGLHPPKMTFGNVLGVIKNPTWAVNMLRFEGLPQYKTLAPYMKDMKKNSDSDHAKSMLELRFRKMRGSVSLEALKSIRDLWQGVLIIKGILSEQDMDKCIKIGADGVIVSNHGGRQLDNGQTAISVLPNLVQKYGDKIHICFDSGIESGGDMVAGLASGAEFVFSGRAFCYGVAALGKNGGVHTIEMFQRQIEQVLCQIGCDDIKDISNFLLKR